MARSQALKRTARSAVRSCGDEQPADERIQISESWKTLNTSTSTICWVGGAVAAHGDVLQPDDVGGTGDEVHEQPGHGRHGGLTAADHPLRAARRRIRLGGGRVPAAQEERGADEQHAHRDVEPGRDRRVLVAREAGAREDEDDGEPDEDERDRAAHEVAEQHPARVLGREGDDHHREVERVERGQTASRRSLPTAFV